MISEKFERSNLALELKAGKERLELVLHGLTDGPGVGGRSFRCEGSRAAQKLLTLPSHGFKYTVPGAH